jgi:uncharacterized RDD family membrane protein YckC
MAEPASSAKAAKPSEAGATANAKPKSPHRRVGFFSRIAAHVIDLCIIINTLFLIITPDLPTLAISCFAYFFATDYFFGRSIGKIVFGYYYLDTDEQPVPNHALVKRSMLRALNVLAILSWRKTSVLDLLAGQRLYQKAIVKGPPPKPVSKRASKPSR